LRKTLNLNQTELAKKSNSSAMGVSRWERGETEPSAASYIQLGILAGDPLCWFFWSRAGLRNEDVMRAVPGLRKRLDRTTAIKYQNVEAGSGNRSKTIPQLVALPLVKGVAASHGGHGDIAGMLQDAPIETMIAAPKIWCPNPSATTCVRVKGNSMNPLIYDGYILVVDTSQVDRAKLDGKVVIALHKNKGLSVSRFQEYDHTEVLRAENSAYDSVILTNKREWSVVGKVLWWIGQAP
jgi:SOS-response transcriptional repressor LexA